ncbi:unnamed protein product [Rhizophagus irregularis]|nr:unnamed protein product [Rhizophagus irregularis]
MDTTIENNDDEMTTESYAVQDNKRLCRVRENYNETGRSLETRENTDTPSQTRDKSKPGSFFRSCFPNKKAGEALRGIIEETLYSVKIAEKDYERIKIENEEVLAGCAAMTKRINDMEKEKGDKDLTSGLMIADLENRIRNLEADVTAKERIILEKK